MAKYLLNSKLWRSAVVPKGFLSVTPQTLNSVTCGRLRKHSLTEDQMSLEEKEATQIIKNFTEEETKCLKRLKEDYCRLRNRRPGLVPQQMSNRNWLTLMSSKLEAVKQRKKWYGKLALKEKKKQKKENVKTMKHETQGKKETVKTMKHETLAKAEDLQDSKYLLNINKCIEKAKRKKSMKALMFGSPLVFDFASRDHSPSHFNFLLNTVRQCVNLNILHQEPFHLHCTGLLDKTNLSIYQSQHGTTVYQKDILEVFPAERLIYLTPYTENMLQYDSDDIYVLGLPCKQLSGATASRHVLRIRELGIRSACLPVHHYIRLCLRRERVPLQYIVAVLLDYNFTKDWDKSLKNLIQGLNENEKFIHSETSKHAAPLY